MGRARAASSSSPSACQAARRFWLICFLPLRNSNSAVALRRISSGRFGVIFCLVLFFFLVEEKGRRQQTLSLSGRWAHSSMDVETSRGDSQGRPRTSRLPSVHILHRRMMYHSSLKSCRVSMLTFSPWCAFVRGFQHVQFCKVKVAEH